MSFSRKKFGTKICSRCHLEQDVNDFYSDKNNCDGLKSECKKCHKNERNNRRNLDIIGRLLSSAKSAAKARNLPFELERKDILIPLKCPILDISLYFDNKRGDNTPSIDRVNSNLGYYKDNIIICSWKANRIKGNATINEMEKIYNNWHIISKSEIILPNHDYYLNRILIHCKERCDIKNIIFNITKEDLKIPKLCPILGLNIIPGIKIFADTSPSLDRIDVNFGYIPENVRIISWRANKLKNDATYLEYKRIYDFYRNINGKIS